MDTATSPPLLTSRDRAILAAVAAGRVHITLSCEPDLYIDGLCCCDQPAAHKLCRIGLICATTAAGSRGTQVLAALTAAGNAALTVTT